MFCLDYSKPNYIVHHLLFKVNKKLKTFNNFVFNFYICIKFYFYAKNSTTFEYNSCAFSNESYPCPASLTICNLAFL